MTNNVQEDLEIRGKEPQGMPAPQLDDANLDGRWDPVGTRRRPVRTFSEGFDPALLIDTEIWDQPDNDAPLYDGPKESPRRLPKA